MPTLSVAMIVKNEAQDLRACLDTVKDWVDEIVILDSGSTDETPQIAAEYNARFYTNTDWQGFGKTASVSSTICDQ
ncbi:SPBc2 prophage-derived glycosyltransferase SunS [Mannheimia haemolytica]|uniref:SPBc2 prophage-derived glycosyltransferase SunS n=1 Tax=Mannheimia haemolytica TaxID=75985 RepID=A0A378MYJ5_MANHA|nr:SPBc2 prophage-derived glycosyltransferase SunS [Mannheimia haemolytica]